MRVGAARHLAQATGSAIAARPMPAPPLSPVLPLLGDALISQVAPTCTVQLNVSAAKDGTLLTTGKLRMSFPPGVPGESQTIAFEERPHRDALRVSDDIAAEDRFEALFGSDAPNAALTGAVTTEGGDVAPVNMVFIVASAVAEASEDVYDISPSIIEYAFGMSPAHKSVSIFPPGDLATDAALLVGCGLVFDGATSSGGITVRCCAKFASLLRRCVAFVAFALLFADSRNDRCSSSPFRPTRQCDQCKDTCKNIGGAGGEAGFIGEEGCLDSCIATGSCAPVTASPYFDWNVRTTLAASRSRRHAACHGRGSCGDRHAPPPVPSEWH